MSPDAPDETADRRADVTVRWFPPSWIEISHTGGRISVDPAYLRTYFAGHPSRIDYSRWPTEIDGLPEMLEPSDVILVTHHHKDHCKRVTVARVSTEETTIVAPATCVAELAREVTVVTPGDTVDHPAAVVRVLPAHNTPEGRSTRKQHPPGRDVGYLVDAGGVTVYHAGDTDVLPEMADLGRVDVACLPIGGTFTMDPEEAVAATVLIRPRWVIPMHRLKADVDEFVTGLEASGSTSRVAGLAIGSGVEVAP